MKISLFGAPGCGKGTQAKLISEKYHIPHISTGALFREAIANKTPLGLEIEKYMTTLVPDEITIKLLLERLNKPDCISGYILDGFPRNIAQADKFLKLSNLDYVLYFKIDEKEVLQRVSTRRTCGVCGEIYNTNSYKNDLCKKCGGKLVVRNEDNEFEKRIYTYKKETSPLVDYFAKKDMLISIDANNSIDEVFQEIQRVLGEVND